MARFTPDPRDDTVHDAGRVGEITDITFYAWIAQAEAGDVLIYHRGFLVVDVDKTVSMLPTKGRIALGRVSDAAFRAAEQGLVHLVQQRLKPDRFAYVAIARPEPKHAAASLSALLLAEPEKAS